MTKVICWATILWLTLPVWAQASLHEHNNSQELLQTIEEIRVRNSDVSENLAHGKGAACLQELDKLGPQVMQVPLDAVGRTVIQTYYAYHSQCKAVAARDQGLPVTLNDLQAWIAPLWERVAASRSHFPADDPVLWPAMKAFQLMHQALLFGPAEEGEAHFAQAIQGLIERANAQPPDAAAEAELRYFARAQYGSWRYQAQVLRTQTQIERGLGEGHPATLVMLRAAAYHERYLGRPAQALNYIERATALTKKYRPQDEEMQMHMAAEHAACLSGVGRPGDALPILLQVRAYFESRQPTQWMNVTRINYNLAGLAFDIGDYDHAIEYAERAFDYAKQSDIAVLRETEIIIPATTKALAQLRQGDAGAAQSLKDALLIIGPPPAHREMHVGPAALALVQDAVRRGDAGMLDWAIAYTDDHIAAFRAPLQAESALRPLMRAWREAGVTLGSETVREPLDRALAISLGGRSPSTAVLTQFSMARHLTGARPSTAIWLYKRAANQLQQMRSGLPSDDQDLYRSWLSNYEDDLRAFVNLLIDEGRLPEAEQVLTLVRNEELFEFTRRSRSQRAGEVESLSLTPQEQAANTTMDGLTHQAETAAQAADARLDSSLRGALRNTYRDPVADSDRQTVQDALHNLLDSALPIRRKLPEATLRGSAPLPAHTARLTYLVGRDGLDIISRIGTHSMRHHVGLGATSLNAMVHQARVNLNTPQTDPRPTLQPLWRTLIEPVLPRLRNAHVRRLELVPDGTLRYLPFAALHDGKQFLVQSFELQTQWPGSGPLTSEAANTPPHRSQTVLGLGRTLGTEQHPPLPSVANELAAIDPGHGAILLDTAFTSASLREGLMHNPVIVHIASHFVLDPAGEDKSYLLLGDGQKMSLSDLKQLPWSNVQLALLSACDSAVSVGQGDGREWTGFATTLANAGVRNVLATLWRIQDSSTAQWMKLFYTQLHSTPGSAAPSTRTLARTQRAWLQTYRNKALAHPYYWAPFVWLGAA